MMNRAATPRICQVAHLCRYYHLPRGPPVQIPAVQDLRLIVNYMLDVVLIGADGSPALELCDVGSRRAAPARFRGHHPPGVDRGAIICQSIVNYSSRSLTPPVLLAPITARSAYAGQTGGLALRRPSFEGSTTRTICAGLPRSSSAHEPYDHSSHLASPTVSSRSRQ